LTVANFFWRGDDFGFFEYITIKSHIKVGHDVVIWLSGTAPKGDYFPQFNNKVKDADDIFNVDKFILDGGTPRTASSLWRFHYLYNNGGLYCDTDAFALQKFPEEDWIVCSGEREELNLLSMGVLRAPPHQQLILDCIPKVRKKGGNVTVFTEMFRKHFGHVNSTHEDRLFYPYRWYDWRRLFTDMNIPSDSYSVHLYTYAIKQELREEIKNYEENWCERNPDTLLSRLWQIVR
jgi:hypothetical protein